MNDPRIFPPFFSRLKKHVEHALSCVTICERPGLCDAVFSCELIVSIADRRKSIVLNDYSSTLLHIFLIDFILFVTGASVFTCKMKSGVCSVT